MTKSINCNFTGKECSWSAESTRNDDNEWMSKIKEHVFIGSNSPLTAPVTVNKKSIVGAGSVITKNVKEKSLALTRSMQTEVKNYKRK